MKRYLFLLLCLCAHLWAQGQTKITGRVLSAEDGQPLPGAVVRVRNTEQLTNTGTDGAFRLTIQSPGAELLISYTGFAPQSLRVDTIGNKPIIVMLQRMTSELNEVVISTGYQQIPKERATGSFSQVNSELIDRKVSTDIISRLQDVTPGLIFNHEKGAVPNSISIRGRSTIFSNDQPLIVLDNFPYDGNINDINPNDIDNITVLKDAAAASIWGSRAGNGVIVITTKKGKYNVKTRISFNSNVTVGDKPNLFYLPQMTTADFISVEQMLFAKGYYNSAQRSIAHPVLSPVVQLLFAEKNGTVTTDDANAILAAYASHDVKNDFEKYFYQRSVDQQYALSISGGSAIQKYYLSAGYDNNLDNLVRNGYQRVTLHTNNTYSLFDQKLELTFGVDYVQSHAQLNNPGYNSIYWKGSSLLYPYASLADASGNPQNVYKDFSQPFKTAATANGLLNWQYSPLADLLDANNTTLLTDYRLNGALRYKVMPHLSAAVLYQYGVSSSLNSNLQNKDSYYTRNLINQFSQINDDGTITRSIPLGDILDNTTNNISSYSLRAQLDFNQSWQNGNSLAAIGGYELKDLETKGNVTRLYGYDNNHDTSQPVNYTTAFPQYYFPLVNTTIPNPAAESGLSDRYLSWYANAAFTYHNRFIFSGSARLDESNLFGVRTNQQGVPLWSVGAAWNLSQENWYRLLWLPYLKLRLTYGYNGNVNKNITAYTTASTGYMTNNTLLPYGVILNPPNPDLKWERDQIINMALDFETKADVLSGSLDYYRKKGMDLIGTIPFPPSTGISTFTGNDSNTAGQGIDIVLNTKNIDRTFKWQTSFFYSYATDKVTKYLYPSLASFYLSGSTGYLPLQGKPQYAIYSYKWAGLDPATGNPQGYLNGQISQNYASIIQAATPQNIVYNGPARPTSFGAIRNTFIWKQFSLSANISYRLGYYFRKISVNYFTVLQGLGGNGDFEKRWQKPGDEQFTQVSSMPAAINANRDNFYTYSSILVLKGDNIRFQDISLGYDLTKEQWHKAPFNHLRFYLYANNLGLLWTANKQGLDPDYQTGPQPRTLAAGIKADF